MPKEKLSLVDYDRFISLWQEFYPKMTDEDKALLPLVPIYFSRRRLSRQFIKKSIGVNRK